MVRFLARPQLSSHGAGPAAEFGIIFVGTIFCLDNELAVGKVGVVCALICDRNVLNRNGDWSTVGRITIVRFTCVSARVHWPTVEDDQSVVLPYDLNSLILRDSLSIFVPIHGRPRVTVDSARNWHCSVQGKPGSLEVNSNTQISHLRPRSSRGWGLSWRIVVSYWRSSGSV